MQDGAHGLVNGGRPVDVRWIVRVGRADMCRVVHALSIVHAG